MGVNIRHVEDMTTGRWEVHVRGYNSAARAVQSATLTFFRGVPTQISSLRFTEPYGPAEATITLPAVSPLEPLGAHSTDLWWVRDGTELTIEWIAYPTLAESLRAVSTADLLPVSATRNVWTGVLVSVDGGTESTGVSVQAVGSLRVLDNYLMHPQSAARPMPVEQAIKRAFTSANQRHPTRLGALDIRLHPDAPTYAPRKYTSGKNAGKFREPWYLRPTGLTEGMAWSGFTTRDLGAWNKTLTEYIDPMLKLLRTEFGQYTIRLDRGNIPVMLHRETVIDPEADKVLIVNVATPGVQVAFSSDYSQTLTTVYGKAESMLSGMAYDGMVYSADGQKYWFKPFAGTPGVDPDTVFSSEQERDEPGWAPVGADIWRMRREVYDEFPRMDTRDATAVARRHLSTYSDPGFTGTLTLTSMDPLFWVAQQGTREQMIYPRQLICAGNVFRLDGLNGMFPGPLVMATEVVHAPEADTVTITYDSRFRDYTSVREIKLRQRDALKPTHSIDVTAGFKLNVEDPIIPWSYQKGSGYFPYRSRKMWEQATEGNDVMNFPDDWYAMAKQFPPKGNKGANAKYYSKISASPTEDRGTRAKPIDPKIFWNLPDKDADRRNGQLLLAEKGTIDQVEILCVDEDGDEVKVSFHVSVWPYHTYALVAGPRLPKSPEQYPYCITAPKVNGKKVPQYDSNGRHYKPGTAYPFFKSAFDTITPDGEVKTDAQNFGLMYKGWGNYWERAGYYPLNSRVTDNPSGVFADSTDWQFDQAAAKPGKFQNQFLDSREDEIDVAMACVLIFCDDRPKKDLYFFGRFYKKYSGE